MIIRHRRCIPIGLCLTKAYLSSLVCVSRITLIRYLNSQMLGSQIIEMYFGASYKRNSHCYMLLHVYNS